jgi:hypothetical protein
VELKAASSGGLWGRLRRLVRASVPRARMVAPPQIRLGERMAVEWGLDCPEGNAAQIAVTLVGSEIERQRVSARTGITVVSQRHVFRVLPIARAAPEPGLRVAYGLGTVVVPRRTSPSLTGQFHEIAWAIVVEASFRSADVLRESFPLTVLASAA